MKDRERAQEANQRLSDMSDSFAREALKKLAEKMEATQENKTSQIRALQEKLREHVSQWSLFYLVIWLPVSHYCCSWLITWKVIDASTNGTCVIC